jgi:hypothetical protein
MTSSGVKEKYFEALGVAPKDQGATSELERALTRAHDIRKFEIELYWKRATYFWALEAGAFAAFALLWHDAPADTRPLALAFAGIGLLTALAGWLSARGSKFWQENWEKHIDMLEDNIEGRLHKTVWIGPRGTQFSVSRLNQQLNLILGLFWLVVLSVTGNVVFQIFIWKLPVLLTATMALIAIFAAAASLWRMRSDLSGEVYEEGAADWKPFHPADNKKFRILLRYAPGERPEA